MNAPRKPSVSIHRRILLVFLISIALPGSYLGYVGLRSIVQEQELQQGLLVQNVGRALQFEIDRIEQRLEESEENIGHDLIVSAVPHISGGWVIRSTLPPWVEQAIVVDSRLNLRYPIPFAPERSPGAESAIEEPSLRNKIESAMRLEVRGNHVAALAAYQRLQAEAHSLPSRVVLNAYVARSAAATGDQPVARGAYEEIIRTDSTFLISRPIPYAAFAWLEIADILVKQGSERKALEVSLQFYRRLRDFYYRFSPEQYSYLSRRLRALIDACAEVVNPDDGIRTMIRHLEEQEHLLIATLSRAGAISSWLKAQRKVLSAQAYISTVSHHSLPIGDRTLGLSLIRVDQKSGPPNWVVLVLRPEQVQREFILRAMQSGELADGFNISIRPDSLLGAGQIHLASSPMHRTAPIFPFAVVSVSGRQASAIKVFGVQISLLSVGFGTFAVGIVLLGIFIIYRDIRREEELSKMKSEFISNVSHELKTPIAAIRMLSDNLLQSRVTEESRKTEYYELISKESARLSHLIDNILDFSRLEGKRKALRFETLDVVSVVDETVRQFKSLMDERSHPIDVAAENGLPEIRMDSDAVSLAVFNLLDNAAKYSGKESMINVRVYKEGGALCIAVSDRGVGIPRGDQGKIFEKFYRVQRTDGKKVPGSGIGLTLVREVAEAHNGRVELQSEVGRGSTFRIMLPIGG